LIAATLRPETVFGQTNLWINPEIEYFEAKVGNEIWILSKEALEKLRYQRKDIGGIGKSSEILLGKSAIAPAINREIIILPSRFVDKEFGSGIVTSVPSDAPYDYVALKELQGNENEIKKYGLDSKIVKGIKAIPIIKTLKYGNEAGVKIVEESKIFRQDDPRLNNLTQKVYKEGFHNGVLLENCGKYSGMKVIEAKEQMKNKLIKNDQADIMYETSRKAFSRSGGKIIVAVLYDQWFIDFNAKGWKEKANSCLSKMIIVPETNRKLFEDTFKWLDKRPCARRRGLGTEFPFDKGWMIESLSDSTIYMTLYTINHLIKKYKLTRKNLNQDFFDFVYLNKGTIEEASKKTKVKKNILKQLRECFEYWMPNDQRHTFILHLSNHLSFMIFAFAGLFPEKYWPKKITFHGLIISGGEKMSKSRGNVITLSHIKENYGADVFRFYLTQSTNIGGTFDWKESEAQNAKKNIEKLYSEISELISKRKKGEVKPFYEHKFNKILKDATEKVSDMKLREYNNLVVYDMFSLIKRAKLELNEKELAAFYNYVVKDWIKIISPVTPHIAEELWQKLGNKKLIFVENWPIYDEKKIDESIEKTEKKVEELCKDINNVSSLVKSKGGTFSKVYVYVIPKEEEDYKSNLEIIKKKININIEIYAVNDPKIFDPEQKARKARQEKPAL